VRRRRIRIIAIIVLVLVVEAAFALAQRRMISPGLRVGRTGKGLLSRMSMASAGRAAR